MAILPGNVRTEFVHARLRQIFFELIEVTSQAADRVLAVLLLVRESR